MQGIMVIRDVALFIAYVVGFLIIFLHQRKKINALSTAVQSQKSILDSAKKFMDIFDLEKVKRYVEMERKTVEGETKEKLREIEEEKKKLSQEYEEKMKKRKESFSILIHEHKAMMGLVVFAMSYVPPADRFGLVELMDDSVAKETFKEQKLYLPETIPYRGNILGMLLRGENVLAQTPETEKDEPVEPIILPKAEK